MRPVGSRNPVSPASGPAEEAARTGPAPGARAVLLPRPLAAMSPASDSTPAGPHGPVPSSQPTGSPALQQQDKHFSGRIPSLGDAGRSATGRRDHAMPPNVTIPCPKPLTPRTIPRPGPTSRTTTPRRRKPPAASRTRRPAPSRPSSRRCGPALLPRNALLPRSVSASRSPPFLHPHISAGLGRSLNLRLSEGRVNTPTERFCKGIERPCKAGRPAVPVVQDWNSAVPSRSRPFPAPSHARRRPRLDPQRLRPQRLRTERLSP